MSGTLLLTMLFAPVLGSAIAGATILLRRVPARVGALAIAGPFGAAAAAGALLADAGELPLHLAGPSWIAIEGFASAMSISARPLGLMFALLIAIATGFILIYGLFSRRNARDPLPILAYANLGLFFLLLIASAESLLLAYVGWHGLGGCASLIVGSLRGREPDAREGLGAFLVHRIGDLSLLVAVILLHRTLGTVEIGAMRQILAEDTTALEAGSGVFGISRGTAIGICLLVAAAVKSALVPAQLWLERAAGARPSGSAFVQGIAATAGVLLVVRLDFLFAATPTAAILATLLGAASAVLGAAAALLQWDLGRVLVWSTTSQLGFATVAAAQGRGDVAVLHLLVHAFAKCALVLGAANVTRAMRGERDMRAMGGLARRMPATFAIVLGAALVLAGAPPLGGFLAQTRVLLVASATRLGHGWLLWLMLSTAAFLGACALGRLAILVFTGSCRAAEDVKAQLREVRGLRLVVPAACVLIAALAILIVVPGVARGWLAEAVAFGGEQDAGAPIEAAIALMSAMVAVAGLFIAYSFFFKDPELADAAESRYPDLAALLRHGFRLESFWDRVLARPLESLGERAFSTTLDRRVALRAFDRLAAVPRVLGARLADAESGLFRGYFAAIVAGLLLVLMSLLSR